jgi:hypothetical protein
MKQAALNTLSTNADSTIVRLTRGLEPGGTRRFTEPTGIHMPLRVARLADCDAGCVFTVGHYFESRIGSRFTEIPDPEVVLFGHGMSGWIPLSRRTPFLDAVAATVERRTLVVADEGEFARLIAVVDAWMVAIQTNLLDQTSQPRLRARSETKVLIRPVYLAS